MTRSFTAALAQALDATLPRTAFAMAYGSGVFQQTNHDDPRSSMVDLVLAVDDACVWNEQNLARHPHHYSMLQYCGAAAVADFQETWGAGVYYNTMVPKLQCASEWTQKRLLGLYVGALRF